LDEIKKSKDMYVTQENLNHCMQAIISEIRNLGDDLRAEMRLGFDSLKTELRTEMREMEGRLRTEMHEIRDELRAEMQAMGGELRAEMKGMGGQLRGEMQEGEGRLRTEITQMGRQIRSEIKEMDLRHSRSFQTLSVDLSDLRIEVRKGHKQLKFQMGELNTNFSKVLATCEETKTIAIYAMDGYQILSGRVQRNTARIKSVQKFISKF
jgi:hypothetical protein